MSLQITVDTRHPFRRQRSMLQGTGLLHGTARRCMRKAIRAEFRVLRLRYLLTGAC